MKQHTLSRKVFATASVILGSSVTAFAEEASTAAVTNSGDTAWILTATALVLFMTMPGLALFYGGLVRSKNVLSVMAQCAGIACLASILWVVALYSLAFKGGDGGWIGNLDAAFLNGVTTETSGGGNIPETLWVMFQMTFAIITPALYIGAVVERMKFSAIMVFTGLWLFLVYAPVAHWVWGGGWLAEMGIRNKLKIDDSLDVFAVHGVGGILGTILLAFFGQKCLGGLGHVKPMGEQLGIQLTGLGVTIVWSAVATVIIMIVVKKTIGIRVSAEEEDRGLDLTDHGESAYSEV